jgi:hypothetical protein
MLAFEPSTGLEFPAGYWPVFICACLGVALLLLAARNRFTRRSAERQRLPPLGLAGGTLLGLAVGLLILGEVRYDNCVSDGGVPDDAGYVAEERGSCTRSVFGGS